SDTTAPQEDGPPWGSVCRSETEPAPGTPCASERSAECPPADGAVFARKRKSGKCSRCSTAAAQSSVRTDTLASYSACCARAADAHAATMTSGPTTPARNRRTPVTSPAQGTVGTCVHHASKDTRADRPLGRRGRVCA